MPLNAMVPKTNRADSPLDGVGKGGAAATPSPELRRTQILLAYVFAVAWFISTAMAAHLPALLQATGASLAIAVSIAAFVGPAQVAGRLLEFGLLKHAPPMWSARLATLAHPLGVFILLTIGTPGALLFALLHGAGNGIMTIAIGTLPLLLFGPAGYGQRQGLLMVPARVLQASAPFLFGLAVASWGDSALWLSAFLGLTAAIALLWITPPKP